MNKLIASAILALSLGTASANAATFDFTSLNTFTLTDFQTALADAQANPNDPLTPAAEQCFTWGVSELQGQPLGVTIPKVTGVASAVEAANLTADAAQTSLNPLVDTFNKNCGWYVEDTAANAARVVGQNFNLFGLIKF